MEKARIGIALFVIFCLLSALSPPLAMAFGRFTVKDEAELGEKFNTLVRSRMPVVEDPEVVNYVNDLVGRIYAVLPPQPFPVKTSILRDNTLNAFAAPAGYLFVNTGLILAVNDESQLAGVLAHELSHVSQRHMAGQIERSQYISLGMVVGMLAGALLGAKAGSGGDALMVGSMAAGQSAMLSYSRDDEREADQVGLGYLIAAGYNPQGMVQAFEHIRQKNWLTSGSNGIPAYMTTHPGVNERIGYLNDRIDRIGGDLRSRRTDNGRLLRVQMLLRSRSIDPELALPYYERPESELSCLDLLGRGILFSRLNRIPQAKDSFDKALACNGKDYLWLREAGRFAFGQGDFKNAGKYLQEAVMRAPQDLMALFFYAKLLAETGQVEQGAKYLDRILLHLPEDAEVHSYLGRFKGQAGDLFGAHQHLAYAAVYANNRSQARFHLDKARNLARTEEQKQDLEKLERAFKGRSEYW